ncbi:MAG: peptidoglycan endopeptidase LytF [Chlamydiales bacterium]|jgi:peptidoglycan endopeptidase LytF
MSRRDTILVAILINAGLLLILFITAMTSEHPQAVNTTDPQDLVQIPQSQTQRNDKRDSMARDEVDQVIRHAEKPTPTQLAAATIVLKEKKEEITPPKTASESSPVLFKDKEDGDQEYVEITVKRGDFLERIARANATSIETIMKLNHLPNTQLQVGQVLIVPIPSAKELKEKRVAAKENTNDSSDEESYYTVKRGDNPWLIAMKHRLKLEDLLRINDLDDAKARKLKPGDKIRIR